MPEGEEAEEGGGGGGAGSGSTVVGEGEGGGGDHGEDDAEPDSDSEDEDAGLTGKARYSKCMGEMISKLQDAISNKLEPWLKTHLETNDWWVRACHAKYICKILKIKYAERGYYKDIRFWFPDIRWNTQPHCPNCKCSDKVTRNGRDPDTPARRVTGLNNSFFILCFTYQRGRCKEANDKKKATKAAKRPKKKSRETMLARVAVGTMMGWLTRQPHLDYFDLTGDDGLEVNVDTANAEGEGAAAIPHNFRARHPECLRRCTYEPLFPAFFTWRAGVDRALVDMQVPLIEVGVRYAQFASMIEEMHKKESLTGSTF